MHRMDISVLRKASFLTELEVRRKPYWFTVSKGVHLGFYKGPRTCTWLGRRHLGGTQYTEVRLGPAAPHEPHDGNDFIGLEQALERLTRWADLPERMSLASPQSTRTLGDEIDKVAQGWQQQRPDLDFRLIAVMLRLDQFYFFRNQRTQGIASIEKLEAGEVYTLMALRRAGDPDGMRPKDLHRALLVTLGAVSKRLDSLEAAGLVRRRPDPADARSSIVTLTARGRKVADRAMGNVALILNSIAKASGLSADEFQQLDSLLRRLLEPMREATEQALAKIRS